jgi:hypothetical protein
MDTNAARSLPSMETFHADCRILKAVLGRQ